ncbi:MAG: Phasin [Methylocystaceae bacterium]|nr:MAG: Phasin [Methylocystaceae bacterium]
MANLNFDDMRELGKQQFDIVSSATNSTAKGLRAIAAEATDYSRQSFDNSRAFFEKLLRVQKLDDIIQLQSEFARTTYGDFIARASKVGELCSNLAREAFVTAQNASEAAAKSASETTDKALSEVQHQSEQFVSRTESAAKQQR